MSDRQKWLVLANICLACALVLIVVAGAKAQQWRSNGNPLTDRAHAQTAETLNTFTLENAQIGTEKCPVSLDAQLWNESEKAGGQAVGLSSWGCKASFPCTVTTPNGEEAEGSFLTGERAIVLESEKRRRTQGMPWPIALTAGPKLRFSFVTLTYVDPCLGLEISFRPPNGTLEPSWFNGIGNGLSPSNFNGREEVLTSPMGEGRLSIANGPLIGFPSAELITEQ